MKELAANWAEPFRSLVHRIPVDAEARSIRLEDWMVKRGQAHSHPRVVLVGDSAHTMTMFRGEGANNAIVDVLDLVKQVDMKRPEYGILPEYRVLLTLCRSFESQNLVASLATYEEAVFLRAEPSFLNSRQACLDAHQWSRIVEGSPLVAARVLQSEASRHTHRQARQ